MTSLAVVTIGAIAVGLIWLGTEVLTFLSKGFTIKEIAGLMGIKWFTVNDHIKSIYKKLNVSSRAEAAVLATKQGLV